jgi:23S rRNA pseudouridine2605 synthase
VLLTDDGELTQHLTHPRYEQPRVYRVLVIGEPTAETLDRWQRGVNIDDKPVRFDSVKVDSVERGRSWLRITVHEGSKHMIRRAVTALEFPVLRLIRIAMGPVKLGDLRPGRWRYIEQHRSRRPAPRGGDRRRRAAPPWADRVHTAAKSRQTQPPRPVTGNLVYEAVDHRH